MLSIGQVTKVYEQKDSIQIMVNQPKVMEHCTSIILSGLILFFTQTTK